MNARPPALNRTERQTAVAEIVRSLHGLFQSVEMFSKAASKAYGVSGPQLWALRMVDGAGSLSVGELAARMYLHLSTVSSIARRLERGGMIVRERSGMDQRVVQLRITAKGRAVLRRAPEAPRSRILRGVQRLPDEHLRTLRHAAALLTEIMRVRSASHRD